MFLDPLKKILFSDDFLPHIHCYLDNRAVIKLHLYSDLLIALAYYSIPIILFYFIRKKADLPFKGIFFMFAAFILACGTTHLMEVWTLWFPDYWLSGVLKAITALLSIGTAIVLIPTTPKALSLRSPHELEKRVQERTEELLKANLELKREIREREKAEFDLKEKSEELERSNRELEQFAYVASHDLQEPLYIIAGFADTIKEQNTEHLSENTRFLLDRIQNAAGRMRLLIADLLQFARVNSQAQPFQSVDLNSLLEELIQDFEIKLNEAGASIEVGTLPTLEADRLQMRQLFQNLIGNSIKFRQKGLPLKIKIESEMTPDGVAKILVQDNGIGFEKELSEKILQPFQRLHKPGEFEGSGLGLAICQKIVFRHHGSIQAEGTPQQGARFSINIPLRQGRH